MAISMSKRKKKKRSPSDKMIGRGFELGKRVAVMALADMDFNQLLVDAKVIGCAYGFSRVSDYEQPIPTITLVGEEKEKLKNAFEHFQSWGAEVDGDVVDVQMLLKRDGTYRLWIGPEPKRAIHRILPNADLCAPLFLNVAWIKHLDSTNPIIFELKDYLATERVAPVLLGAAQVGASLSPNSLAHIETPEILKFDLKIISEIEDPENPLFHPGKQRNGKREIERDIGKEREEVINVAFPVTKQRLKRAGFAEHVRAILRDAPLSEDQITQAAINLIISDEISAGDRHFQSSGAEYIDMVWKHIFDRVDFADSKPLPAWLNPDLIAKQIELDVRHLLRLDGVPVSGEKFKKLQALFLRKGYARI